jgi:hypothetical protein
MVIILRHCSQQKRVLRIWSLVRWSETTSRLKLSRRIVKVIIIITTKSDYRPNRLRNRDIERKAKNARSNVQIKTRSFTTGLMWSQISTTMVNFLAKKNWSERRIIFNSKFLLNLRLKRKKCLLIQQQKLITRNSLMCSHLL